MTDRMDTKALQALVARGNIKPDRAINHGTLDAAAAAALSLAAEVLELRARVEELEKGRERSKRACKTWSDTVSYQFHRIEAAEKLAGTFADLFMALCPTIDNFPAVIKAQEAYAAFHATKNPMPKPRPKNPQTPSFIVDLSSPSSERCRSGVEHK